MRKHFTVAITDRSLTVARDQAGIDAEARLDGIYVIRTLVPETELDAAGTVTAYKNLKYVELRFAGTPAVVPVLTEPTSRQKQAFDLIGAPVPAVLRK